MDWLFINKNYLEAIYYCIIIIGGPCALINFYLVKKREQRDREYGTYDALDEKYIEFQHLCLEHPYLDVFDIPDPRPKPLNEDQAKEEKIAFAILMSIFERAYLMYKRQSQSMTKKQWSGWESYVRTYFRRDNFRMAWGTGDNTFDKEFEEQMNKIKDEESCNILRI